MLNGLLPQSGTVQDKKHAFKTCSSIQGSFPPLIWPTYIYVDITHITNAPNLTHFLSFLTYVHVYTASDLKTGAREQG